MKWYTWGSWILNLLLVITIMLLLRQCNDKHGIEVTNNDSVTYWRNAHGQEVASKKQTEADWNKRNADFDSLAKLYNTKPKRIIEYVTVTSRTVDTIYSANDPVIIYTDTGGINIQVSSMSQDFESPYYKANALIHRDKRYSRLSISSTDTLDLLWKQVKEGNLFNRKTYVQIDVKNRNPNTKITHINAYRQKLPNPKKFGIGVQIGYGIGIDFKPQPYIGAGISYNLIRF